MTPRKKAGKPVKYRRVSSGWAIQFDCGGIYPTSGDPILYHTKKLAVLKAETIVDVEWFRVFRAIKTTTTTEVK